MNISTACCLPHIHCSAAPSLAPHLSSGAFVLCELLRAVTYIQSDTHILYTLNSVKNRRFQLYIRLSNQSLVCWSIPSMGFLVFGMFVNAKNDRKSRTQLAKWMQSFIWSHKTIRSLGNTEQMAIKKQPAPVFVTSNNLRSNRCLYDLLGSFLNLLPLPH